MDVAHLATHEVGDALGLDPLYNVDYVSALALDGDGALYSGGTVYTRTGDKMWVRKSDADNTTLWSQTFQEGTRSQPVRALAVTSDGGVIAGGASRANSNLEHVRFFLRRYDADGGLRWSLAHADEPGVGAVNAVAVDAEDTAFAAGHTDATDRTQQYDLRVARYATEAVVVEGEPAEAGVRRCAFTWAGPGGGHDTATAVTADALGRAYAAGKITDVGGVTRAWVGRIGSDCALHWYWVSPFEGSASGVALDADGRLIVVGDDRSEDADGDVWMARFAP